MKNQLRPIMSTPCLNSFALWFNQWYNIEFFSLTQVVNSLYAFAIYISYGLNGFVPIQLVWDTYLIERLKDSRWKIAWEYLLRVMLVGITGKYKKLILQIIISLINFFY